MNLNKHFVSDHPSVAEFWCFETALFRIGPECGVFQYDLGHDLLIPFLRDAAMGLYGHNVP